MESVEYAAQDEKDMAEFLFKVADSKGITYKEISQKTSISQTQVQRFLSGRGGISFYNYAKIARFLGYRPDICPENGDLALKSIEIEKEKPKNALYGDKNSENDQSYDLTIEKAYEELANAVVETACDDYRYLRKKNLEKSLIHHNVVTIKEIEKFFKSEYFGKFTNLDGNWLLNRLKKEV